MKLIVFADLHYFGGDLETALFNKSRKLVQFALPMLDRITDIVNERADACVNLGDTIQDMNDKQADLDCLKMLFEKMKRIQPPCYTVLGNHDLKMMDTVSEVEEIVGRPATFSVDMEGYHLVFLTTEIRPELGLARGGCYKAQYLSEDALRWLENDLRENRLPCLVFTHYGLAEDENFTDGCMFMKNRAEVKAILKNDPNLLAVFSGHQHRTLQYTEDGVEYYVLGSITTCWDGSGVPCGVYFELELEDGKLTVLERHIQL